MTAAGAGKAATSWLDRHLGHIAMICTAGTCLCFIGLGYLQSQVSGYASAGARARVQQCEARAVSVREQNWFHKRGVIDGEELSTILSAFPSEKECREILAKRGR